MNNLEIIKLDQYFVQDIKNIISTARQKTYTLINNTMIDAYWQIGERIVKQEQGGNLRAEYGKRTLLLLAEELNAEFNKGFDERELRRMRQFYLLFPIRETLSPELSWSHYIEIIRVENTDARNYYIAESKSNQWSVRQLRRNISTLYFERLLMSADKQPVIEEMIEKTTPLQMDKNEILKNPFILEFLDLNPSLSHKESQLEQALMNNLQQFLLEMGKGFAFVARQKMVKTDTAEFFIDLVFYNYLLKCFVLIELKTHTLQHADIGQIDMYVRMFDDLYRTENDNPTIGILLCTETDKTIAKYSVLKNSEQLFASKYKLFLPTEEELRAEIEREKEYFRKVNGK
ncbi:MAG: PDDEXK nuclease domain-containing protein [Bacteroidales bacterium]